MPHARLADVDAICVPGGFGIRGIEGKLGALTFARTHKIPTLGLCLGLQCMVIEFARQQAGLDKAASTEFDPDCLEPVIATMAEQHAFVEGAGDLGGTMRLGLYPAELKEGTRGAGGVRRGPASRSATATATRSTTPTASSSRPPAWCSPAPRRTTTWSSSSSCPADVHPYYVATQAHPELRSRPTRPHPLFAGLIEAAIQRQRELLIPIDESALRRRWVADDDVTMDEPDRRRRGLDRASGLTRCRTSPTSTSAGPSWAPATSTATTGWWRCARTSSSVPATPRRPSAGSWSSTRAPSSCSRSTTRSGSAACASTATPAAGVFVELPAGLCDQDGEDPQLTAARELREEVELQAEHWRHLLTLYPSAGLTDRAAPHLPGHAGSRTPTAATSSCTPRRPRWSRSGCRSRSCSRRCSTAGSGRARSRPPYSPTTS